MKIKNTRIATELCLHSTLIGPSSKYCKIVKHQTFKEKHYTWINYAPEHNTFVWLFLLAEAECLVSASEFFICILRKVTVKIVCQAKLPA